MVHVGDDGNVSNVLHIIPIIFWSAKLQLLPYICGIQKKKILKLIAISKIMPTFAASKENIINLLIKNIYVFRRC